MNRFIHDPSTKRSLSLLQDHIPAILKTIPNGTFYADISISILHTVLFTFGDGWPKMYTVY